MLFDIGLHDICEQFWPSSGQANCSSGQVGIYAIKTPSDDLVIVVTSPHPSYARTVALLGHFQGPRHVLDIRCCLAMCLAKALTVKTESDQCSPVMNIEGLLVTNTSGKYTDCH